MLRAVLAVYRRWSCLQAPGRDGLLASAVVLPFGCLTVWSKSHLRAVRKFAGVVLAERVCCGQAGPADV